MTAANPHLRAIAIAGALAAAAVALGMWTLTRQQPSSTAATPLPVHHPAPAPPAKARKPVVAVPKISPYVKAALAADLPKPVAEQFAAHEVVVVTLYSPDADLDRMVAGEAQAGAMLAGAGFVGVDVSKELVSGELTRAFGVLAAPTSLVLARTDFTKPTTTLAGFNDRETVAQAATNADPSPGGPTTRTSWAQRAEALCGRSKGRFSDLGPITTPAQLKRASPKVKAITDSLIAGLAGLTPPAGRGADVKKFVSLARQDVDLAVRLVRATIGNDPVAVATASAKQSTVGAEASAMAISLGAPSCGEPL